MLVSIRRLGATLVVLALLAGCSGTDGADEGAGVSGPFDWKRFSGETVTVLADQNPWQKAIEPLLPEFEQLTGMKVKFEALPEDQFRQRRQVALTGRSASIDLFMSQPVQDGAQFQQQGWYQSLAPYLENLSLTSPDYEYADFSKTLMQGATVDGTLIGIPILLDVEMLYYRKDILAAAGVEVPKTFDELRSVAEKIANRDGVLGYAARGKGGSAVTQMSTILYNFGADWTDSDGRAAFGSPEGVRAFQFYGSMLRDFAPKGITSMSWEELLPLFNQGRIAIWHDSSSFLSTIVDPKSSVQQVRENIGYAVMPSGPGGGYNATLPWSLSMSSFSNKKVQAWQFIQWATSKDVVTKLQASGVAGGRSSVPFPGDLPEEWVDAFKKDLAVARPKLPTVVPVKEVRDAIGEAIVACINDASGCEAAVRAAADKFDEIVKAS